MRIINALLSTSVLFVFLFPQALAAPPGAHLNITQVFVDDPNNPTSIMIIGVDLDFGSGPLSVTLGEFGALNITTSTDTLIEADLPGLISDGDYLLTVSNGNGQSQNYEYDLTTGAVGPQGPAGPSADLANEVCSLYQLTGFSAPQSLASESPEATCDDGLDNDCDGDTDDADSDCAPPVACPCTDIYDRAIAAYTGAGGDLENGWDLCALTSANALTHSMDRQRFFAPLLVFTIKIELFSRAGVTCAAAVLRGGIRPWRHSVKPIFLQDRTIDGGQHAACTALQATLCE